MHSSAKPTAFINVGRAGLAATLHFYSRHWGGHPDAYIWARIYWLSPFIVAVIGCWMVTAELGWPQFERLRLADLREGFSFSLSGSSISTYNDIDKTFLVSLGQTFAAGIYAAASRVVDVATAPLNGIYAAAAPGLFREGARSVGHANAQTRRLLLQTVPYGVAVALALYSGAGLFARALDFENVTAVESAGFSADDLKHNLVGKAHRVVRSSALDFLRSQTRGPAQAKPELILLDPPRAGLEKEICTHLGNIGAPAIVYISCDPATLARDIQSLLQFEYSVQTIHLVDLFPQTFHMETVTFIKRN